MFILIRLCLIAAAIVVTPENTQSIVAKSESPDMNVISIQDFYNEHRSELESIIVDLKYVPGDDVIVGKRETYKYTTYALYLKIKIDNEYGVLNLSIGERTFHDVSTSHLLWLVEYT